MYLHLLVEQISQRQMTRSSVPRIGSSEPQVSRFRRIWAGRGAVPGQKTYLRDAEIDLGGNRQWLGNFITGCQGEYVNLSREDRVPEFWTDSDDFAIADLIVLSVGTCFGAIRCIACFFSYSFWAFGMLFGATKVQSCPVFWSILGPNFGQVQVCRSNLRLSSLYLFAKISRKNYIASILLRCQ